MVVFPTPILPVMALDEKLKFQKADFHQKSVGLNLNV
jgi:hypothetical protein